MKQYILILKERINALNSHLLFKKENKFTKEELKNMIFIKLRSHPMMEVRVSVKQR